MLELTYTNSHGEILTLRVINGEIFFNHSDIHESDTEWENIKNIHDYFINSSEWTVVEAFTELFSKLSK